MLCTAAWSHAQAGPVVVLTLHDTLQPVSAGYIHRGLAEAARRHASLVLLAIRSPGGLDTSTRAIVADMQSSRVPVAVMADGAVPAAVAAAADVRVDSKNAGDAIRQLEGKILAGPGGTSRVLHLQGEPFQAIPRPARERFLSLLTRPDVAVVLLALGVLLVYAEFNVPGTVVLGSVGALLVMFSIFGFLQLPLRGTAVLQAVAGLGLTLLELRWRTRWLLPVAGNLLLIVGLLRLVNGPIAELRVHPTTAIVCGILLGTVTLWLASIALRARRNKAVGRNPRRGDSIAFADTGSPSRQEPTG